MSASSFPCPHCSTTLRVRDRKYIGRQIACPDCRQPIEIIANGPRGLAGKPAAVPSEPAKTWRERVTALRPRIGDSRRAASAPTLAPATDSEPATTPTGDAAPGRLSRAAAVLVSPVGVAWTFASVVTLGLVVLIWRSEGAAPRVPTADRSSGDPAGPAAGTDPHGRNPPPGEAPANPAAARGVEDQIRQRLVRLGERLDAYRGTHGHFPSGTVAADGRAPVDRFSWLAELAAGADPPDRPRPFWDQRWHDPLNDRFVRQPRPEFLNPAVAERTGRNRFPATHFVGMAGVGPDAPELPVDHPRAGIFGYHRRTRLEDIKDGTAHTILVAGAQQRLGGWAGGGHGSVRPLTREPYVNGPDGFGTGQADRMLILMADGSVRTVSKATSPVIVRRMAAMADGFPLDDAVKGEPGDEPLVRPPSPDRLERPEVVAEDPDAAPPNEAGPAKDPADAAPDEPPVAAPEPAAPKIDIAAALAQKIEHYELPRPVAARRLLLELEEMIGVPLETNGGNTVELEARLDQTVSVRLEKTTVGGILDEVTRRAGLAYTIDSGAIRLRPADAGANREDAGEP